MAAEVIPIRQGRPSLRAERDLDHAFHASEEQEQARIAEPLLHQLEAFAADYGPAAMQVVARLTHWHTRHARRWAAAVEMEEVA